MLVSKVGTTETSSQQEVVFETLASKNEEQLRNFIAFIIRSTVHKSGRTVFRNQAQAIDKIINTAIWSNFHLAVEKVVYNNLLISI